MKSITLSGFPRENVGKRESRDLRLEQKVPCVLYGTDINVHFWAYGYDFNNLLYTPEKFIVNVEVDGKTYRTIIKASQFHPVSETIEHVDFLVVEEGKPLKVSLPIHFEGNAIGVRSGGRLMIRRRELEVYGLLKDMPEHLTISIAKLKLGKVIRVKDVFFQKLKVLSAPQAPIVMVKAKRAVEVVEVEEDEDDDAAVIEGAEGAEGAETTAAE